MIGKDGEGWGAIEGVMVGVMGRGEMGLKGLPQRDERLIRDDCRLGEIHDLDVSRGSEVYE